MKICGIELTGNDAVICLLELDNQQFILPDCRVRKITLPKNHTRGDLQYFQSTFVKLMNDYGITKVAIKERAQKGKFSGGAIGFKLEAAIQLIGDIDVVVIPQKDIKLGLSGHVLPFTFAETGLKVFQEAAFTVAYVAQVMR
ncbi:MAG: hypothetical protein A6F70_04235 [Cycloclasticus sp. symbiont of Bathymodiolus heckerae]|nr:MAG: hypothetical protein A6F70_04235 [Cycloclasticus sp. symbiont of Bathymodiolus heckerae]